MDTIPWHSVKNTASIFSIINSDFCLMQEKYPNSLPIFQTSSGIIIASDYSGENEKSPYQVFSFLLVGIDECLEWNEVRNGFRKEYFPNDRRMAFKNLNDNQRRQALSPFLKLANQLPGFLFTIAIDKTIDTLFEGKAPIDLGNQEFHDFKTWKPKVLEKAFRIVHFAAFLTAGFSFPNQNILWFSDEDSVVANFPRLTQLTNIFASVLSGYVNHNLAHIRFGTTNNDDGTLIIEDLTSIPDLVAGAISEQLILSQEEPEFQNVFWLMRPDFTRKTSLITRWLSDVNYPLKRCFFVVRSQPPPNLFNVSWFHFHNQI